MKSIIALSHSPDACDWLANSRHPLILHVFDRACNLINEHREVLSIVTQQIGNGPFNLVIEADVLFSDYLNALSPISIRGNQLNLGNLTINTGNAKLWSPRPDWETLHAKRNDILNQLISLRAFELDLDLSFATSAHGNSIRALTQRLPLTNYQPSISNLQSLVSALANSDFPSSLTATQKLAGLGVGLTPAGDDFILGAMYAAWIIHPPEIAGVLAKEITNIAAPLSTSLSAAWLRSAGRGEAGILWHEFFDTLISTDTVRIQKSVDKILAVGETSGADALAGFSSTIMCWGKVKRSKIP